MESKCHAQTYQDYYYKENLPENKEIHRSNTNPRYKFFRQNYFTAGDYEQFLDNWNIAESSSANPDTRPEIKCNTSFSITNIHHPDYYGLCLHDFYNTFLYIFEKFKKGLFMRLSDQQVKVFLPFSKVNFKNEWYYSIRTNPKYFKDVNDLMDYVARLENKTFAPNRVNRDIRSWYGNNGLVRLEFPISEGDSGLNMLKDMFECLVRERDIPPGCDFFINKRDFPLLKKNKTEPYKSFFGETPLKSHCYKKYAPILSMTTSPEYADIPIPTWEDWCRVSYQRDGKLFWKEFKSFPLQSEFDAIPWEDKIETAVFRGASTGLGTTPMNNIRLFYAKESLLQKKHSKDNVPYLDAGITKWNLRPRKFNKFDYLDTIHIDKLNIPLSSPLSPLEQAKYKYILHLPGHSCAYRLSLELSSGSLVLFYPCEFELWFSRWLVPWKHYVPIDPSNPLDVYKKIDWCKNNDEKVKKIVENARQFSDTYLSRESILDYLQSVLVKLNPHIPASPSSLTLLYPSYVKNTVAEFENRWVSNVQSSDILGTGIRFFLDSEIPHETLSNRHLFILFMWMKFENGTDGFARFLQETRDINTPCLQTKQTVIYRHSWKNMEWISKQSMFQHFPSSILCSYLYLNPLSEYIPFFMKTYSFVRHQNTFHILSEYVRGETLETCIKSSSITIHSLLSIFSSLTLALQFAQDSCGFLHMDLYPWNIIIKTQKTPLSIRAPWKDNKWIQASVSTYPVMIDYDKSFFIHEGNPIYQTRPFYHNRLQDIISIVFSSLYLYLEHHSVHSEEQPIIFRLLNFFSGKYTGYTKFTSIYQIKAFLRHHKKYSNMVGEKKLGLEQKTPNDFLQFLIDSNLTGNDFSFSISEHDTNPETLCFYYPNLSPKIDLFYEEIRMMNTIKNIIPADDIPDMHTLTSELIHEIKSLELSSCIENIVSCAILQQLLHSISTEPVMDKKWKINRQSFLKKWTKKLDKEIISYSQHNLPDIPFLCSHICNMCAKKENEYFNSLPSFPFSITEMKYSFLLQFYFSIHLSSDKFHSVWFQCFRKYFYAQLISPLVD